jgi:hypothetical protein
MDRNKGLSSYKKPSEAEINLDSLVNFAEKSARPSVGHNGHNTGAGFLVRAESVTRTITK